MNQTRSRAVPALRLATLRLATLRLATLRLATLRLATLRLATLRLATLVILLGIGSRALAQTKLAELSVAAGEQQRLDAPVMAVIYGLSLQTQPGAVQLYEVTGGASVPVAFQLRPGDPDRIAWILSGITSPGATRNFELRYQEGAAAAAPTARAGGVSLTDTGESLRITIGERPVLEYRYALMPVPEGVDSVFRLSGFIHPLWSPEGEVLSRIQPRDHYHHYGIWNPWTQTEFEGRTVDFWNIGSRQGRVVSAGVVARSSGPVFGSFKAIHHHIDHTSPGGDRIALEEQVDVTVWNASPDRSAWVIDFRSTLSPATDQGITIKAYRYQGFSMRATEKWNDQTARLLTSEGYDKSNANSTRARWIDVNGVSAAREGTSGVLFMTNPANYNYPEHLRIWPTGQQPVDQNVYINFNPAQDRDWVLEAGKSYGLQYRMYVYDGRINAAAAERLWASYANPPQVEVRVVENLRS